MNLNSDKALPTINQRQMAATKNSQVGPICCSRHLACIETSNMPCHIIHQDDMSINTQLLAELEPIEISANPVIQYEVKAEVDLLAQANIKKKEYQKMLKKYQAELQQEQISKRLQTINFEAKEAIQKSKKIPSCPKDKWNHSIFSQIPKRETTQVQSDIKAVPRQQNNRKVQMKPINERIADYKQMQATKAKKDLEGLWKQTKEVDIERHAKATQARAEEILKEMKQQKLEKEKERKIIQAKVRAIQLQSLKQVQRCKKKPLEVHQDFDLGDSQYSTFSARAQQRKIAKKKKKEKPQMEVNPSLKQTKKSDPANFLRRSASSIANSKVKLIAKTQQLPNKNATQSGQLSEKQEVKGPFFIWNIPICPEDIQKLQKNKKQVFMNVERFNYKTGKTFREEANQYLAKKLSQNMQNQQESTKHQQFLNQVQNKKQVIIKQYENYQQTMEQHFWNEDQVFKPNILQNFHFFSKDKAV